MHVGGFQALLGGSKPPHKAPLFEKRALEPWVRLKFHAGWSDWTRPPTMAGGGRRARPKACLQGGVEGVFEEI